MLFSERSNTYNFFILFRPFILIILLLFRNNYLRLLHIESNPSICSILVFIIYKYLRFTICCNPCIFDTLGQSIVNVVVLSNPSIGYIYSMSLSIIFSSI